MNNAGATAAASSNTDTDTNTDTDVYRGAGVGASPSARLKEGLVEAIDDSAMAVCSLNAMDVCSTVVHYLNKNEETHPYPIQSLITDVVAVRGSPCIDEAEAEVIGWGAY